MVFVHTLSQKIFSRKFFPVLLSVVLVIGLFLTVLVSRENQDRRGRAQTTATEPETYGYGSFSGDTYTEASGAATPTTEVNPTEDTPSPTEEIATTSTPTNTPTPVPTNTPIPTATPTSIPIPVGTGLRGSYFNNRTLSGRATVVRIDPAVNFLWSTSSPHPSIKRDDFSVAWQGYVVPKYSETYTFYTNSDDGIKLWVNNQLLINNWTIHGPTENKGTIALQAGQRYYIRIYYFEAKVGATAQLRWSSPSTLKQIIPKESLIPLQ